MILIINICYEKLHDYEFVKPIEDILKKENIDFESYHYKQLTKDILNRAKKIIICGTSLKDEEYLDNFAKTGLAKMDHEKNKTKFFRREQQLQKFSLEEIEKFEWIKNIEKPIFGICAGIQIIGLVFGGELKKNKEIGSIKINFDKEFFGLIDGREVYALHNNCINFSKDFEIYAKNKNCIQAVKHKDEEIYGTLFHPEVRNKDLIKKFCG